MYSPPSHPEPPKVHSSSPLIYFSNIYKSYRRTAQQWNQATSLDHVDSGLASNCTKPWTADRAQALSDYIKSLEQFLTENLWYVVFPLPYQEAKLLAEQLDKLASTCASLLFSQKGITPSLISLENQSTARRSTVLGYLRLSEIFLSGLEEVYTALVEFVEYLRQDQEFKLVSASLKRFTSFIHPIIVDTQALNTYLADLHHIDGYQWHQWLPHTEAI